MLKVSFSLISNINQSACSILHWVLYKHHWDIPTNEKTIPMLTCPIWICISIQPFSGVDGLKFLPQILSNVDEQINKN